MKTRGDDIILAFEKTIIIEIKKSLSPREKGFLPYVIDVFVAKGHHNDIV